MGLHNLFIDFKVKIIVSSGRMPISMRGGFYRFKNRTSLMEDHKTVKPLRDPYFKPKATPYVIKKTYFSRDTVLLRQFSLSNCTV